jgi:hypothetical protein
MAAVTTAILAAATIGSLAYGAYSGEKQRGEARRAASAAKADQARLENETKAEKARLDAIATRDEQRNLQKSKSASFGGRGSTILTSPLGLPGNGGETGKTLLGM